jgi:class 3 adenylate cyclase
MKSEFSRTSAHLAVIGLTFVIALSAFQEVGSLRERLHRETEFKAKAQLAGTLSSLGESFSRTGWLMQLGERLNQELKKRFRRHSFSDQHGIALAREFLRRFRTATVFVFNDNGNLVYSPETSGKRSREILWQGLLAQLSGDESASHTLARQRARSFCQGTFGTFTTLRDLVGEQGQPKAFMNKGAMHISWILPASRLFPENGSGEKSAAGIWLLMDPQEITGQSIGRRLFTESRLFPETLILLRRQARRHFIELKRGSGRPSGSILPVILGQTREATDSWGIWRAHYLPGENGRFLVGGIPTRRMQTVGMKAATVWQGGIILCFLGLVLLSHRYLFLGNPIQISIRSQVTAFFVTLGFIPIIAFSLQGLNLLRENSELGIRTGKARILRHLLEIDKAFPTFSQNVDLVLHQLESRIGRGLSQPSRIVQDFQEAFPFNLPFDLLIITRHGRTLRMGRNLYGGNSLDTYQHTLKSVLANRLMADGQKLAGNPEKGMSLLTPEMKFRIESVLQASTRRLTRNMSETRELLSRLALFPAPDRLDPPEILGLVNWEFDGESFVRPFVREWVSTKAAQVASHGILIGAIADNGDLFPADFPMCPDLRQMVNVAKNLGSQEADFIATHDGRRFLAGILCPGNFGGFRLIGLLPTFHPSGVPAQVVHFVRGMLGFPVAAPDAVSVITGRILFLTTLLSAMLLIPSTILLSGMLTHRLQLFQSGVRAIAAGDFTARLPGGAADELGAFADGFNQMAQGLEQRERMKRFVSDQVLAEVKKEDEHSLALGGEKCEVAILFSHIQGFDAMVATEPPEHVLDLLNAYFSRMDEVIKSHDGVIDKLIGDAVMAVFHHLPDRGLPADRAVNAARDMLTAEDELNRRRQQVGLDAVRTDIGIHRGTVISGKIGSEKGLIDFTVIGDTVNTSARLQSHAAGQPRRCIVVSKAVAGDLPDKIRWEPLPAVLLKGKTERLEIFIRYG